MTLTDALTRAYALLTFGLLAVPILLGVLAARRPSSGGTVNHSRTRFRLGMAVLFLAAVVGLVGWFRVSGEPLLNRQVPLLASAGLIVLLLSALGGSLIVSEQLRGDQQRLRDLEDAVRSLTEALSPSIELPARRATEPAEAEVLEAAQAARPRRRKAAV